MRQSGNSQSTVGPAGFVNDPSSVPQGYMNEFRSFLLGHMHHQGENPNSVHVIDKK